MIKTTIYINNEKFKIVSEKDNEIQLQDLILEEPKQDNIEEK